MPNLTTEFTIYFKTIYHKHTFRFFCAFIWIYLKLKFRSIVDFWGCNWQILQTFLSFFLVFKYFVPILSSKKIIAPKSIMIWYDRYEENLNFLLVSYLFCAYCWVSFLFCAYCWVSFLFCPYCWVSYLFCTYCWVSYLFCT